MLITSYERKRVKRAKRTIRMNEASEPRNQVVLTVKERQCASINK